MNSILNIFQNLLKRKNFFHTLDKLKKKFEKNTSSQAIDWINANKIFSNDEFCRLIDSHFYDQISSEINEFEKYAKQKLINLKISLGGGGNYKLLYFLVRKFKLNFIVETGVAAGWSSLALLKAFNKNGFGSLYSSDFPYYRIKDPEKYIGILAKDEANKQNWYLDIRGDSIALPEIIQKLKTNYIDLFHYDSDKSYEGREKSINIIDNKINSETFIIFDDIQDNLHFKDFIEKNKKKFFLIKFQDKYIGVVENKILQKMIFSRNRK